MERHLKDKGDISIGPKCTWGFADLRLGALRPWCLSEGLGLSGFQGFRVVLGFLDGV